MMLLVVTKPDSSQILANLIRACVRLDQKVSCFFTNDGVLALDNKTVLDAVQSTEEATVCMESWRTFMGEAACPVQEGSQTHHSRLVAEATAIVSL